MSTSATLSPLPDEEGVVCPTCLLANAPTAAFCSDCGAPIGMFTTVDPLQKILAEGFAYRAAAEGPPKLIVLVGVWMLFFPMAAALPLTLLFAPDFFHEEQGLVILLSGLVCSFMLYRVTKNYIGKTRAASEEASAEE